MMASVCMITYNHENFIAKAIEGILMQKTNFDFELIIGEDCSTDKTKQICQVYASKNSMINLLLSKTNLGMMSNFLRNLRASTGKYIALCEGDDYWTDPYKLQKQVDFLENNLEYGMVFTNYQILTTAGIFKDSAFGNRIVPARFSDIIYCLSNYLMPHILTMCFRRSILTDSFYNFLSDKKIIVGDYALLLWLTYFSEIKYSNEITGVHRRHISSFTNKLAINYKDALSFKNNVFYILDKFFAINKITDPFLVETKNRTEFYILKINFIMHACHEEKQFAIDFYSRLRTFDLNIPVQLKLIYYFIYYFPGGIYIFRKIYLLKKMMQKALK